MKTTTMLTHLTLGGALALAVIGATAPLAAGQERPRVTRGNDVLVLEYDFDQPTVVEDGARDRVAIRGLGRYVETGAPVVPVRQAQILVPSGMKIESVTSEPLGITSLAGTYQLEHGADQFFRNLGPPITESRPDPAIYGMTGFWPVEQHELVTVQIDRGYEVAHVNLFPLQVAPRSGRLRVATSMRLTVRLTRAARPHDPRPTEALEEKLRRKLDNPATMQTYGRRKGSGARAVSNPVGPFLHSPLSDPSCPYFGANWAYVVITNDTFANITDQYSFQALCDVKTNRGVAAGIVTTDWIVAHYSGRKPSGGSDDATRIRNFLMDAYRTWGTEYALLGGNKDIVPPRLFYEGAWEVPADLYYGCVDPPFCTFDCDADGKYGERFDGPGGGDIDLRAEIFVGRASVHSVSDVTNFVQKTLTYESTNDPYLDVAASMGGYLGFGDIQEFNKPFSELVRLGSDLYLGHFTAGIESPGIPHARNFTVHTLYDEDYAPPGWNRVGHVNPPWDYYSDGWDATTELIPILNGTGGHTTPQLVYIADHGATNWGMVKLCTTPTSFPMYDSINKLTNTNPFFFYDDSCLLGAFDTNNCFAEQVTTIPYGAFACVVNSRDGLGAAGNNLDSVTTMFTREYFHSVLGDGVFELGRALQEARESSLWRLGSISWFRYQYYELTLFGDPELSLRVDTPPAGPAR